LMTCPLYPKQMMNSWKPKWEYIFIIWCKMGLLPISIIGFGFECDSSLILVPNPPAKMTTFKSDSSPTVAKSDKSHAFHEQACWTRLP
jgi:hypothetical protein